MPKRKPRPCPADSRLVTYRAGLRRGKRIALGNVLDMIDELRADYELNHCMDMWDFFEEMETRMDNVIRMTNHHV